MAYATGEPYAMVERIVRPDGDVRYLSSNGQVMMDDDGRPVRMRGTCIDITDRVHAEQERERNAALIQRRPRYERLTGKAYPARGRHGRLIAGRPLFASPDERQNAGADDRHLAVIDLLHAPASDQKA